MEYIDEKIENFLNVVIKGAMDQKNREINKLRTEKQHKVDENELAVLEKMYHTIQSELSKIRNDKNEKISKTMTECKNRLLLLREDAVNGIMKEVLTKIQVYLETDRYKADLNRKISNAVSLLGQGSIVVTVREADKDKVEAGSFEIETTKEDIIGGFMAMNREKKTLIDETISKKLSEQKQYLFEMKELQID